MLSGRFHCHVYLPAGKRGACKACHVSRRKSRPLPHEQASKPHHSHARNFELDEFVFEIKRLIDTANPCIRVHRAEIVQEQYRVDVGMCGDKICYAVRVISGVKDVNRAVMIN